MTELSEYYRLCCVVRNCQRAQLAYFCIKCFAALNNNVFLKADSTGVSYYCVLNNWHFYDKYCVQRAEIFPISTVFRGLKHLR